MNHDPFKINAAILDLWRDLKAGEDYIYRLEIRNASLVSERERIEPELEQRCRELNLSLAQQAIHLKQIEELKAELETIRKDRQALFDSHKTVLEDIQRLHWELRAAKEGKPSV